MIEVAAALSAATTAFNAIKKGFEVGRDIESMSGDLSRWMGAASDINKADEYAEESRRHALSTQTTDIIDTWTSRMGRIIEDRRRDQKEKTSSHLCTKRTTT